MDDCLAYEGQSIIIMYIDLYVKQTTCAWCCSDTIWDWDMSATLYNVGYAVCRYNGIGSTATCSRTNHVFVTFGHVIDNKSTCMYDIIILPKTEYMYSEYKKERNLHNSIIHVPVVDIISARGLL